MPEDVSADDIEMPSPHYSSNYRGRFGYTTAASFNSLIALEKEKIIIKKQILLQTRANGELLKEICNQLKINKTRR